MLATTARTGIPKRCAWDEFALRKRDEKKNPSTPANVPELEEAHKKHPDHCFVNYLITELVQRVFVS